MRRFAVLTVGGLLALTLHAAPVGFEGDPAPVPEAGIAATAVSLSVTSGSAVWLQQLQAVGVETGETATQLLHTALGLIGVPYRRGGSSAETGFDCSGFVRYVYANTLGLVLPRRAAEQAQATTPIAKDELRPGDLVFFNTMRRAFSHVGVYLGNGKFIHSPSKGDHVKISDLNDRYWARRFNGARRVDNTVAPLPAAR
ncbi:MAG: C40 family peptidase [Tepidimonas taiwanensis]|nr:C40 family peptidase [Tepidimonas taiwanensis]